MSLWQLLRTLRSFEDRTWRSILRDAQNHSWEGDEIEQWSAESRARLQQLRIDTGSRFYQLGIAGKGRLFGIREREVFAILWWDRDHVVYKTKRSKKSNKKHRANAKAVRDAAQAAELSKQRIKG